MKYFLLMIVLLVPTIAQAATANEDSVAGIYEVSFENGMVPGPGSIKKCEQPLKMVGSNCSAPYTSTDTLGLYENKDGSVTFAALLFFGNGHMCFIDGTAEKVEGGWHYKGTRDGEAPCNLLILNKSDKIAFSTSDASCSHYCGSRGGLNNAEFPLSSKIKYKLESKDDVTCMDAEVMTCKWQNTEEAK